MDTFIIIAFLCGLGTTCAAPLARLAGDDGEKLTETRRSADFFLRELEAALSGNLIKRAEPDVGIPDVMTRSLVAGPETKDNNGNVAAKTEKEIHVKRDDTFVGDIGCHHLGNDTGCHEILEDGTEVFIPLDEQEAKVENIN